MTASEIIEELRVLKNEIPREALIAAVEQRGEVVPLLIEAIEEVTRNAAKYESKPDYMLHVFAFYLLAEMREPGALPAVLGFFRLPDELPHALTGDLITEEGARILASVCGGDIDSLKRLFEDDAVDEYVRGEAISALVVLATWGELPRENVLGYFRELFTGRLPRSENHAAWTALVGAAYDLNARELIPEMMRAFDDGLVIEDVIDLDFLAEWFEEPDMNPFMEFAGEHPPILNTAEELEEWACFSGNDEPLGDQDDDTLLPLVPSTIPWQVPPKTGRDDPCPCGSGKKFKKCCGS
jgi:hypothetical protein